MAESGAGAGVDALVLVLGDQLDPHAAAFDGFDPSQDAVWMAEVAEESTHVWSAKPRIAMFLSAMRHFAEALRAVGRTVHYTRLDDPANRGGLAAELAAAIDRLRPNRLVMTAPGDWRVLQALGAQARAAGLTLDIRPDRHFYTTVGEFSDHLRRHRALRMETFYREQRRRHDVLMVDGEPEGGRWNYDVDNREAFPKSGPGELPAHADFQPDGITRDVVALVDTRFADHPGSLDAFAWPVTRADALRALAVFVDERLPLFGRYEDAMWPGEPWLYHSQLSSSLNLKLLDPREVVGAAVGAWRAGKAPLAGVEGFVRQILGWREYVRGVYWTHMPAYLDLNALDAREPLPAWYWNGATDFACLREVLTQTLALGYAHHIQRLMVSGLFALLLGVRPQEVHAWYLAVYVDAVEWVELPNTLGMSQYGDGGVMASKPYIASGRYIERMGGPCRSCRYEPGQRVGETACPFTTLYWDFLMRHEALLAANHRMAPQVRNLGRLDAAEREAVRSRAAAIRRGELGKLRTPSDPSFEPMLPFEARTAPAPRQRKRR